MTIDELLNAAKSKAGCATDMALAERIGVTRQAVSNWRHESATPDPVACEKLAILSGIPLHRVLGIVGEVRAISAAEKRVWRKLANIAAGVFFASVTMPTHAENPTNGHHLTVETGCIMRSTTEPGQAP